VNPPVSLNVLRRWSNRSLANAFALQAAIIALGSSLLVALISLGVIFGVEQATLRERLQEKSRRLAERVETSIDLVERSVRELANNPIFTTALLDSTGRNTYVVPFLESYKFPVVAASGLALCDINGERLAGMRSPLSDCRATSPLFKQVIAGGKTLRELVPLKNGHLAWTVYQGVVFPYTGTIEGVVVTQLDLHDILSPLPRDLDIESVALVRAGSVDNLVGAESGRGAPASLETARSPLFGAKADAAPIPLDVVVKDALSPFDRKLIPLVLGYGLGSLLLILLVIYRARRVSQQLVVPLTRLTDVARDIAEKGDLSIAVPHLDVGEVAQLARAFDVMVNTLRISEASLETKVALRTQELRKSEAAAEAANLAKSRFLATMSHEIRTPMNGILGMAQMLLMPDLQEDEQQDYARTILTSGQTLMALLNDILDLSKVEAGKFQLEIIPFDPEQLIHETRSLFAEAAALKQLRLECHWRGGTGQRYQADAHRLRQMLANFVGNAVKFTPRGTIRIEAAEIEHDAATALLEFSVIDTGIGIPEDKRDLLFLPFSQADSSTTREFGGSGLGLSIVRGLAKLMGGEVGVESEAGKGSRLKRPARPAPPRSYAVACWWSRTTASTAW